MEPAEMAEAVDTVMDSVVMVVLVDTEAGEAMDLAVVMAAREGHK